MAALRSAVSPDFTYSQSYLSLLSSAGCMTGVICCASFAIRNMVQRIRERQALRLSPSLEVHVSGPTARNTSRATRTVLRQEEEEANDRDLEKDSSPRTDISRNEKRLAREIIKWGQETFLPFHAANVGAVALFDFQPSHEDELGLKQGQLVWIHYRRGDGWLLAENLRTNEIGLAAERFLQLRGETTWIRDKTELSKSLQSRLIRRAESAPE